MGNERRENAESGDRRREGRDKTEGRKEGTKGGEGRKGSIYLVIYYPCFRYNLIHHFIQKFVIHMLVLFYPLELLPLSYIHSRHNLSLVHLNCIPLYNGKRMRE